jgi:hypothetical protein
MGLRRYLSHAVLPRVYESQSLLPESFVRPTERERGTAYPILSVPSPKVLVRSYPRQHGKWRHAPTQGAVEGMQAASQLALKQTKGLFPTLLAQVTLEPAKLT